MYEVDIPFWHGVKEFDDITILSQVMRKCGGYFIKDDITKDLHKAIIEELYGLMMKKRMMIAYHLEKSRERSGKIKPPQDYLFQHYINAYLRNAQDIDDVLFVPITINYDKIYEGQ